MDATFLNILRGLEWDTLTISQASEVMGALRDAVRKGEEWYRQFSAGFVDGMASPLTSTKIAPMVTPMGVMAPPTAQKPRKAIAAPVVKRGRGRPRKVVPGVVKRGGEKATRLAHNQQNGGSNPPPATPNDHPPVGILAGSYVSTTGPDPNRSYSLPAAHPRAGGGVAAPTTTDPDFAAVEAGKVRFQ